MYFCSVLDEEPGNVKGRSTRKVSYAPSQFLHKSRVSVQAEIYNLEKAYLGVWTPSIFDMSDDFPCHFFRAREMHFHTRRQAHDRDIAARVPTSCVIERRKKDETSSEL